MHHTPTSVRDQRLQLHYAAGLLASTAHSLLAHASDDSHSALNLRADGSAFATQSLNASGLTLGLQLDTLQLRWRDDAMAPPSQSLDAHSAAAPQTFALPGATVADAYRWLNASRPANTPQINARTFPDFPAHALADGATFDRAHADVRIALGHTYAMAGQIFSGLHVSPGDASDWSESPIRLWPHHFDLGLLITLERPDHQIGVGLSPGDSSYDQPYFYVSPYPQPPAGALLPDWQRDGHWHSEGFCALVLTEQEWTRATGHPRVGAERFVRAAVARVVSN